MQPRTSMLLASAAALALIVSVAPSLRSQAPSAPQALPAIAGSTPRNIVFILADDHRYDAMGFMHRSFVQTPNMDALAREGAHVRNAFVTTALCSPSRASILTGLYAHRHRVVDNNNPVPPGTIFFPQYLQQAGYQTAFIGKWHMGGGGDDPQPGFDRWVSFRGQGTYLPSASGLNVDGKRVPQKGYITDELTDYALDWLRTRDTGRPFFLYLSHKAVHADFVPAERHKGRYADATFTPPASMAPGNPDESGRPMWVQNQRNSWHGVDFPYHSDLDIGEYYKRYAETLLAVDDSIGRVVAFLREQRLLDSTLIVYMGDNGFAFGEHGLIDKRTAYEESMRVPMLVRGPEVARPGQPIDAVIANIDIAPTLLAAAGLQAPPTMDGRNFLPILRGAPVPWRSTLLYEYYWERNFPQTPTMHALRGERWKYIHYQGIWDTDELYDLQADPLEMQNLVRVPAHRDLVRELNAELFATLERTGGMYIPLNPDRGNQQNLRNANGAPPADFPSYFIRQP